jgi:hypothetical protein
MNINHGPPPPVSNSLNSDLGGLNLIGEDLSAPKSDKIDKNSILALYANNNNNSNGATNNMLNFNNNSSFAQKPLGSSNVLPQFKNANLGATTSQQPGQNPMFSSAQNHNNNFLNFKMQPSTNQTPQAANSFNQFQMGQMTPQTFQNPNKNINQFHVINYLLIVK